MALSTHEAHQDEVRTLIEEVLRIGVGLADLIGGLVDELSEDAFPGEDHALVLLDMITGTIRPVADEAGERTVREATALLGAIGERVFSDLRAAAELAGDGQP
jgi:hypothetical protein